MMGAALAMALKAGLMIPLAGAVVLPEKTASELERRFDAYVEADGFTEMDVTSLIGEDWYVAERFPRMGASAFRPDAALDPVTRAVLLLGSREAALPHARYRINYRLSVASPDHPNIRHAFVEVTRFNIGPLIRDDIIAANGGENAAQAEVFGIAPDVAWRLVMGSVMGMRADVVRASRKVLAEAEAAAMDCLGVPCLSRLLPEGPSGDWQTITPPEFDPSVYVEANGGLPGPARIAEYLFAHATRHGEEPAHRAATGDPQMAFVISMNIVGQERTASGLLHQSGLMDDAISDIWTQRRQVGSDVVEWRKLIVRRAGRQ